MSSLGQTDHRSTRHKCVLFNNVRQWARVNKMILNLSETKEIVFRRPCPKRDYLPPSLDNIEQVDQIRCLGIMLHQGLNFELHVQSFLRQCSQRLYLLRMLRSQGIPSDKLHIIFRGIVVARILYAMPAWGPHLNVAQTSRINSFLKRAYKYGFSEELLTVEQLLHSSATCLFNKMHQYTRCLHNLLPSVKALEYSLRNSQSYCLPQCKYQLFIISFVNWCLFNNL